MASQKPMIHGVDHRKGGADPIPGVDPWPTRHHMDPWVDVDQGNETVGYERVTDIANTVGGGYMESTADGDYIIWPVRLGPSGSSWGVFITLHTDTDRGTIEYQWATADDDEYGEGRYTLNADASWVTHPQSRVTYSAAPQLNEAFSNESVFRIKGAEGTVLTSITGSDPDLSIAMFNGGPGLYLFRIHVNGKHASSSDYITQIVKVDIRRLPG